MLLTRSDAVGGASVHVRDLCTGLRDRGINAIVLLGGRGPVADLLTAAGVRVVDVPGLGRELHPVADVRALVHLVRILRAVRPDLVAAHTAKAGALARLAAAPLGLPVTYTPHGWAFDEGVPPDEARRYRRLERILARMPGTVIDVSRYERDLALRNGVGRPSQHLVIHNGIPDVPARLHAEPGRAPPRIVMVARFEPQKDHPTLLRALACLTDVRWEVNLVGAGPRLPEMRRLAADLGLDGRIRFLGATDDVPAVLADGQVFVLSTNWESFPLSVLEAMRAGLPVVASDVGGIAEAVSPGVTGWLVPRGDHRALAARLRGLLTDAPLRRRVGQAGRRAYEQSFTADVMLERVTCLYADVASRRGAPA